MDGNIVADVPARVIGKRKLPLKGLASWEQIFFVFYIYRFGVIRMFKFSNVHDVSILGINYSAFRKKLVKKVSNFLTPSSHNPQKWEQKNRWLRRAGVKIGKDVAIDQDFFCLTGMEENITIDDHTVIGIGLRVWNFNHIRIKKFCMFAADIALVNGGHDRDTLEPFSGPLIIGNGCWIGHGAKILGPLTIGDNVIVGAGAIVTKDVMDGDIVAGVPARVIGKRNLPSKVWHLGNTYFSPYTFTIVE